MNVPQVGGVECRYDNIFIEDIYVHRMFYCGMLPVN